MEVEPLETEKEDWQKERLRVLDEWSEIELKGAEALKMDVTHEPGSPTDAVAAETSLQDLYPLLAGPATSSAEKEDVGEEVQVIVSSPFNSPSNPNDNRSTFTRFMDICLCRPTRAEMPPLAYTHKTLLIKLSQTPYDEANGTHWLLLSDYFANVTSAVAPDDVMLKPARVGPHWVNVGFQSATPHTDFRGCGVLGLLQMHTFTQKLSKELLKACVVLATTEPNDFPLAVVSINITSLLLTQLKNGTFDSFGNSTEGLYPFFSSLHTAAMAKFCSIYKSRSCSLAQTQSIFSEIVQQLEKSPLSLLMLLNPNHDELTTTLL